MADHFGFHGNAFNKYFYEYEPDDKHYAKQFFEVSGFMNNTLKSYDVNVVSRVHNGIVAAMRDQPILPKYLVLVPDDDIINYALRKGARSIEAFERIIKWIMNQCYRLVMTHGDNLPIRVKRCEKLIWIWIQPPMHANFPNNYWWSQFSRALEKCAVYFDRTYALQLKKVWEEDNKFLYSKDDQKFTVEGYKTYWCAVDKAIRFANTLMLKKETIAKEKALRKEKTERQGHDYEYHGHDHRYHKQHDFQRRHSLGRSGRFHWNRHNQHGKSHWLFVKFWCSFINQIVVFIVNL